MSYLCHKYKKKWGSPTSFQRRSVCKTTLIWENWRKYFSMVYKGLVLKISKVSQRKLERSQSYFVELSVT